MHQPVPVLLYPQFGKETLRRLENPQGDLGTIRRQGILAGRLLIGPEAIKIQEGETPEQDADTFSPVRRHTTEEHR